ncbi:hypothetical protein BUALT_Bualt07G0159000 [Buddleja alternifolia]|uniref:Uncharacterized protein n=1 Tax=Buddleja alternifolia TaxID=168488 RepID=A0AAV6XFG6_9LAMI|nr:hypothetical protein BUALT_Bualt07G0159000 [Buddleja alternifolia]
MANSKTLIRTGVSLVTRLLHPNPIPGHRILTRSPELIAPPKLFQSLFIPQTTPLHFPSHQNDAESLRKLSCEGFLYPSGLPSLPFLLPNEKQQRVVEELLLGESQRAGPESQHDDTSNFGL